jgi:restriction system protein
LTHNQFDLEERMPVTLEDGIDRWPTFALTPAEYEEAVADLVRTSGHEVTDWQVQHLDPVDGVDGTFIIDVTVRFRFLGVDFLVLFDPVGHSLFRLRG